MRDNQPAWTSQVRHVQPGQSIIVNRDEDPEEGDAGVRQTEKLGHSSTGESSSDRTRRDDIEMREKSQRSSRDSGEDEQEGSEGAIGERAGEDDNEPGTPPVAEYREGDDLIIERKRKGEEVSKHSTLLTLGRGGNGQAPL